jgi:hypothetical protein
VEIGGGVLLEALPASQDDWNRPSIRLLAVAGVDIF